MKDSFKEVEQVSMAMLKEFPVSQLTPSLRERAVKTVEDGRPSEYYAGMFHGILMAIAQAAATGKKSGLKLGVDLLVSPLMIGIAIRWHESCPMEVK